MKRQGFTLIELMIVVAIIGILASVAIPGFVRYVKETKTAEAATNLKALADGATSYYDVDHYTTDGLPLSQKQFPTSDGLLVSGSSVRVPSTIPPGTKFASTSSEWNREPWSALRFQIIKPQYYRYRYVGSNSSSGEDSFTASAEGDLDVDSVTSKFNVLGSTQDGEIFLTPIFLSDSDNNLE
jgi:prepilin-type N-terminal cleavage/methylation domain-containing protein